MRTTLTLDDDLAERLMQEARETRQPFKVVVNDALRRGLKDKTPAVAPFHHEGHPGGLRPGLDARALNHLPWELDDELFMSRYGKLGGDRSQS
jgi:hypothetical protein